MLAACPAAAPAPGGAGGGEAAAEAAKVSLGLTWDASFQPTQNQFDEDFMAEHPDIELEVIYNTWADHNNVVPTWAAANTLPDIVYVHGSRAFPWAFEGITVSSQSYIDNDEAFDVGGIWEEALRLYSFEGDQHAVPYDHGPVLLGYNKDLFDAAGMAYPDETWDMDKLREVALALTDLEAEIPQWGMDSAYPVLRNEGGDSTLGPWGATVLNELETELLIDDQRHATH